MRPNNPEQPASPGAPSAPSAHTPGPWRWDRGIVPPDGPERYADIYVDSGDTIIAHFNDLVPEGLANARLIAAAPELLALAQSLQRWLMKDAGPSHISDDDMRVYHLDGGVLANLLDEARAAIAKASSMGSLA